MKTLKVVDLATGETIAVNPGYAERLIQQGRAVLPPPEPKRAEAAPAEEAPKGRKK